MGNCCLTIFTPTVRFTQHMPAWVRALRIEWRCMWEAWHSCWYSYGFITRRLLVRFQHWVCREPLEVSLNLGLLLEDWPCVGLQMKMDAKWLPGCLLQRRLRQSEAQAVYSHQQEQNIKKEQWVPKGLKRFVMTEHTPHLPDLMPEIFTVIKHEDWLEHETILCV